MTITTGPIVPFAAAPFSFTNETRVSNPNNIIPFMMTRDRTKIYGAVRGGGGNILYELPDDGSAPIAIATLPAPKVYAMIETYDNEILVTGASSGGTGLIYKSSGWSVNRTTATFAQVLSLPGGVPLPDYCMTTGMMGTNGVMVLAEQGAQTVATTATGDNAADNATAITNNATKAHKLYVTVDNGSTWTLLHDQLTQSPLLEARQINGTHPHGATYDELWDRVWLTFGDNTGVGPNLYGTDKLQIIYSDDWRNVTTGGTATWQTISLPVDYPSTTRAEAIQVVGISFTPNVVTFSTDGIPYGLAVLPRTGYRTFGKLRLINNLAGSGKPNLIGKGVCWAGGNFPMFSGFNYGNSTSQGFVATMPRISCSADKGVTWFEIWRDPVRTRRGADQVQAFGPTVNNKVVGTTTDTLGGTRTNGSIITWTLTPAA
jgi:hypothetical protein